MFLSVQLVDRNKVFLHVLSEQLHWEHLFSFNLKRTDRKIGTLERSRFVPERTKEEPILSFE